MVGSLALYNYYDYSSSAGPHRKVEMPVMPSQALYANFTYVTGVPSQEGLSIDKLRAMDSLIGYYNTHRSQAEPPLSKEDLNVQAPDEVIAQVAQKIHNIQTQAPAPYQAAVPAQALVVNTAV